MDGKTKNRNLRGQLRQCQRKNSSVLFMPEEKFFSAIQSQFSVRVFLFSKSFEKEKFQTCFSIFHAFLLVCDIVGHKFALCCHSFSREDWQTINTLKRQFQPKDWSVTMRRNLKKNELVQNQGKSQSVKTRELMSLLFQVTTGRRNLHTQDISCHNLCVRTQVTDVLKTSYPDSGVCFLLSGHGFAILDRELSEDVNAS